MQLMTRARRKEDNKVKGTLIDWQWALVGCLKVVKKFKSWLMGDSGQLELVN